MATCVCVRGRTRMPRPLEPNRAATQMGQLQFHCGKPPPAADPSTLIFTRLGQLRYGVGINLAAQRNLFKIRSLPLHEKSPPVMQLVSTRQGRTTASPQLGSTSELVLSCRPQVVIGIDNFAAPPR